MEGLINGCDKQPLFTHSLFLFHSCTREILVIFTNVHVANTTHVITFPLYSITGVQFASDKQSIGLYVYIFSTCTPVTRSRARYNKLIKLLARVMQSARPWMEICAFPFVPVRRNRCIIAGNCAPPCPTGERH